LWSDNSDLPTTKLISIPQLLERKEPTPDLQSLKIERKSYADYAEESQSFSAEIAGGRQIYVIEKTYRLLNSPFAGRIKNARLVNFVDAQTGHEFGFELSGCFIDPFGPTGFLSEEFPKSGELTKAEILQRADLPKTAEVRSIRLIHNPEELLEILFPSASQEEKERKQVSNLSIWSLEVYYPEYDDLNHQKKIQDAKVELILNARTGDLLRKRVDCEEVFSALTDNTLNFPTLRNQRPEFNQEGNSNSL
jgi:hypothetical protein